MTTKEIRNELLKVCGKKFDSWGTDSTVREALEQALNKINIGVWAYNNTYPKVLFFVSSSRQPQTVYIKYRLNGQDYCIGEVRCKKAKTGSHVSYFGSYCDWVYDDFEIEFNSWLKSDTLEGCMAAAEAQAAEDKIKKDAATMEKVNMMKALMKAFPDMKYNDLMHEMGEIVKLRYDSNFENLCLQNN